MNIRSYRILRGKAVLQIVIICNIVIHFLCVSSVFSGTSSVHTNMLYNHAYFNDNHWRISSDLIGYNLSPEYQALQPGRASFAQCDTNTYALFSATDNKLYLMSIGLQPVTNNQKAIISARTPVLSPVGSAGGLFSLFLRQSQKVDTVCVCVPQSGNVVHIHHIDTKTNLPVKVDTLILSQPTGPFTTTVSVGGPDEALSTPSGLWICGSRGVVRYFAWNGTAWGTEVVYDIDTAETVSALCKEALGTASGKVYQFEGNAFVLKGQPGQFAINKISPLGAVAKGGTIIKRKGANWVPFEKGASNPSYFNFIARTDGSGVELLDSAWKFSVHTLEDTATYFAIRPPDVAAFVNNGVYHYPADVNKVVAIDLVDPDGNFRLPQITLNSTVNLIDSLNPFRPDTVWTMGYNDFFDTLITLTLRRDSIIVEATIRNAAFEFTTYRKHWVSILSRRAFKWRRNDTILVSMDNQSLVLVYEPGSTVISLSGLQRNAAKPRVLYGQQGVTFTHLPKNLQSISFYTVRGQKILTQTIAMNVKSVFVPMPVAANMLCVVYTFSNKVVLRETIPLIK